MLLCVVYRPPSSGGSLLATVGHMLDLAGGEHKEVILMGDLNINMLCTSSLLSTWNLIVEEFSLTQLISEPTRVSVTTESLIDVIFVSDPAMFAVSGTMPFSNSDHLLIYAERYDRVKGSSNFTHIHCFQEHDVDAFISDLQQVPWHTMNVFLLLMTNEVVGSGCLFLLLMPTILFTQFV